MGMAKWILWAVLGWWIGLTVMLFGIILCAFVVTVPLGKGIINFGWKLFNPFSSIYR